LPLGALKQAPGEFVARRLHQVRVIAGGRLERRFFGGAEGARRKQSRERQCGAQAGNDKRAH
jgi:hypothetical protein